MSTASLFWGCGAWEAYEPLKEFSENQFGLERAGEQPQKFDQPSERRSHERYAVQGEAEVLQADGSQILRGSILDISLSGCFIATRARLRMETGAPVEMVFRANGVVLRAKATLRAVRAGIGAGFLFEGMSERMANELQSLIKTLNLPQKITTK